MPTTATRLRIPNYQTIEHGPGGTEGKDIVFALQVSRIQRDITDGAQVLAYNNFQSSLFCYSIVRMVITVSGTLIEDSSATHTAHPVTDAIEHSPDFIDMEEAAVCWNNGARPGVDDLDLLPRLEITHDGSSYRVYRGVITKLTMVRAEGRSAVDFNLVFAVAWAEDSPTLREWS
jgi:hypothetical protein